MFVSLGVLEFLGELGFIGAFGFEWFCLIVFHHFVNEFFLNRFC